MSNVPAQFPLSLRPWPTKDDGRSALPTLISRINAERGEFRNLTEEDLLEEIAKAEQLDTEADNEEGETEDEDEAPDRLKEVMDAKAEMLGQIEQAHHASMVALDFVALLLSKDQPVQASLSISEGLRQVVALGTLGADKVKDTRLTEARKRDNITVGKGWKIQSFGTSVDSILAAATRLEREIDVETKYWEEILAVDHKGWKTCKLPQERHTLGVRFGFFEAAPAFSNRSLAALRRNPDGTVYLDQGLADPTPKRVTIRVETAGAITGALGPAAAAPDDAPLETLILQARNTIFEEELWQELNREARTLANHGVRTSGAGIAVRLTPTTRILLDLAVLSTSPALPPAPAPAPDDDTAELLSLSLHLLLSHAHRTSLLQRSRAPPPLTHHPRPSTPYPLLRPLLTQHHHTTVLHTLLHTTTSLLSVLRAAGLPLPPHTLTRAPPPPRKPAEPPLTPLVAPPDTTLLIPLPGAAPVSVRLRTDASLQTRFQIAAPPALPRAPPNAAGVEEVKAWLLWGAGVALAGAFAEAEAEGEGWQRTAAPHVLRKTAEGRKGAREIAFAVLPGKDGDKGVRVEVRVRDEEGVERVVVYSGEEEKEGEEKGRSLKEVVEQAGRWEEGGAEWGDGFEVQGHVIGLA